LAGAVAETVTADPKTALKSPLAAREQMKAAVVAFAKLPPKRKSWAELLAVSTAVLCCRCQRTYAGVTETEAATEAETVYAAALARSTVTEAEAKSNTLLLLHHCF
jgi:hypothetical protein